MRETYICDGVRTPIGRYSGSLSEIRADDLAAVVLRELVQRNAAVNWHAVDDVVLGCANQSGEDNRNVARMASLLAGLPIEVSAHTVNRLCASGLSSVVACANAIRAHDTDLMIAGGVEQMTRAPYVMGKANSAFGRGQTLFDTTMGWRFVNPKLTELYGTEDMPRTAENLAVNYNVSRADQDAFAHRSQVKADKAQKQGLFEQEIVSLEVKEGRKNTRVFSADEHLRLSSVDKLATLKPLYSQGSVTAGNASGINDGAAALLMASEHACHRHDLTPLVKIVGSATTGVLPTHMGIGPVSATQKVLAKTGLRLQDMDILEFNEAFSAQVLACTRQLGIDDHDSRLNPRGGAIALGHPLGMSGTRLVLTAMRQLEHSNARYALCAMCVGVGQGVALIVERCS